MTPSPSERSEGDGSRPAPATVVAGPTSVPGTASSAPPPAPAARLRAEEGDGAVWAMRVTFLVTGIAAGSWAPHVPDVQSRLGLSPGQLSWVLLAITFGAVLGTPSAGPLTSRYGSRRATLLGAAILCVGLPLPVLAPSVAAALAAGWLFGLGYGLIDVAMNAHAVLVEARAGRAIISGCHGCFSLGCVLGAAGAGAATAAGWSPGGHLLATAGALAATLAVARRGYLREREAAGAAGPGLVRPRGRLAVLGGMAFFCLLAEGAMMDWSAVYFRSVLLVPAALVGVGYTVYSVAMTLVRFGGDRLVRGIGEGSAFLGGAVVAALGLGGLVIAPGPGTAAAGCLLVGVGLANMVPILFRSAGRVPGVESGVGIAAVATAGYLGFLAGPPLVGWVAELSGLRSSFGLVAGGLAVVGFLGWRQRDANGATG